MSIFVTCSPPEYTNVADQRCENQRNLRRSRKNTPNPKSPVSAQRQSAFISQAILIDRRSWKWKTWRCEAAMASGFTM